MISKKTLSIIIPCYNESTRLDKMRTDFLQCLEIGDKSIDISVLFVNDGSSDDTWMVLERLKKASPIQVDIIEYKQNRGKWYALRQWIKHASSDYYLIMDADGATDMKEIYNFLSYIEKYDIVIGSRISHFAHRVRYKKILWSISHVIISNTLSLKINDTQCWFKMFSHDVKYLREKMSLDRWWFDFELLFLAQKKWYNIKEVPVVWHEIEWSKVSSIDYIKTLYELYTVYKLHNHSKSLTYLKKYWNTAFASILFMLVLINSFVNADLFNSATGSSYQSNWGTSYIENISNTNNLPIQWYAGWGVTSSYTINTTKSSSNDLAVVDTTQALFPLRICSSEKYITNFIDIKNSIYEWWVKRLEACDIIHGDFNQMTYFLPQSYVTRGHIYKIFAWLIELYENTGENDIWHWSKPYQSLGSKYGLWNGLQKKNPDEFASKKEVFTVIQNILKAQWVYSKGIDDYIKIQRDTNIMTRWQLILLLDQLFIILGK